MQRPTAESTHLQEMMRPYLDQLAAGSATPGGGSAAAAAGAMGAALVSMVCNLTIGREKYAAVEARMAAFLARSEALRAELTQLIEDDAQAFNAIMVAFQLPKGTDEEKAARRVAIEAGTQQATRTPLATARACAGVIELCRAVAELGNPNAASDAGAGAACAQAGLKAAALSVLVNLSALRDEEFVAACQAELHQILTNQALADEVCVSFAHLL